MERARIAECKAFSALTLLYRISASIQINDTYTVFFDITFGKNLQGTQQKRLVYTVYRRLVILPTRQSTPCVAHTPFLTRRISCLFRLLHLKVLKFLWACLFCQVSSWCLVYTVTSLIAPYEIEGEYRVPQPPHSHDYRRGILRTAPGPKLCLNVA